MSLNAFTDKKNNNFKPQHTSFLGNQKSYLNNESKSYLTSDDDRKTYLIHDEYTQPESTKRGFIDRVFGLLGYNGIVEGLYNITDDDPDTGFMQGMKDGGKYWLPTTNDVSNRHTFVDVLDNLGWKDDDPDKFSLGDVGRAVAGFAGDIVLDPLTYVGGIGAASKILKGTGTTVKALKGADKALDVAKGVGKIADAAVAADKTSAAVKSVRNAAKAVKIGKKLDEAADVTSNLKKISKFTPLNGNDVMDIAKRFGGHAEEDLPEIADNLASGFVRDILHIRDDGLGEGLTIGLHHLPFATKKMRTIKKTILTDKRVREFGDKTVAPYWNRMLKEIRTSKLGQKLSKNNRIEALFETNPKEAMALYHLDDIQKGMPKLSKDLSDIKAGQILEDYEGTRTKEEMYAAFNAYEKGLLGSAEEYLKIRNSLNDLYQKATGETIDIATEEGRSAFNKFILQRDFAVLDDGVTRNEYIKKRNDEINEFIDKKLGGTPSEAQGVSDPNVKSTPYPNIKDFSNFEDYLEAVKAHKYITENPVGETAEEFVDNFESTMLGRLSSYLDHGFSSSTTNSQIVKGMRDIEKLDSILQNGVTYTDLVDRYSQLSKSGLIKSKYSNVRQKLLPYTSEESAKKIYEKLPAYVKEQVLDSYTNGVTFRGIQLKHIDKEYAPILKNLDEIKAARQNNIFDQSNQAKFLKLVDEMNGTDYMSDMRKADERYKYFLDISKKYARGYGSYEKLGGEEGVKIWRSFADRMNEIAEDEVKRGLLRPEQAKIMKDRYIPHLTVADKKSLETLVRDNANGAFNPDILGVYRTFDKSRTGRKTISEVNRAALRGDESAKVFVDTLSELYMYRCLQSNRAIYTVDSVNYILKNFASTMHASDDVAEGFSAVIPYHDLWSIMNKVAHQRYAALPDESKLTTSVQAIYDEIKDAVACGDETFKTMFSPNVSMQKLNKEQRIAVNLLNYEAEHLVDKYGVLTESAMTYYNAGIDVLSDFKKELPFFAISDNVLDRTNVLSRAQRMSQQSDFLNTFDKYQDIWKLQNSLVVPSFHVQNMLSNAFQSFLGIGADAFNLKQIKKAADIMRLKDPRQTIKLGDTVWTYKQLEYVAKKTDVLDELFVTHELAKNIGTLAAKESRAYSSIRDVRINGMQALNPLNTSDFLPYQLSSIAGTNIEAVQRMNLFMSALKQGNSVDEAVEMVNKFLFDYGALTDFERDVMKRAIPFYTFMRKNFPMELEQMLEQPQTFATIDKAFTNFEKMDREGYRNENERNEWRQDYVQIPYTKWSINPQLPYQQFDKITLNDKHIPNKIIGSLSPLARLPYEVATGEYAYTEIPIKSPLEYLANNLSIPTGAMVRTDFDDSDSVVSNLSRLLGFPLGTIK